MIFFLSKIVPGDPVKEQLGINFDSAYEMDYQREYTIKARALNYDKPFFYFSIIPSNFPDNINENLLPGRKKWFKNLLFLGYDYESLSTFRKKLDEIIVHLLPLKNTKIAKSIEILSSENNIAQILFSIKTVKSALLEDQELSKNISELESMAIDMKKSKAYLIPKFVWYGLDNQYHNWVNKLISWDPGTSFIDGKKVNFKISRALVWTGFLVIFSLVLSYSLGIFLGIVLAYLKNRRAVKVIERFLFGIYAIPIFWLATLLLVFFTTNEYGSWTNIFPSVGLTPIDLGESWYVRIGNYGKQLILPSFCLVIHNLAFLGSLTKRNIQSKRKEGFVMTAKAFGFSEREILIQEVLPHAFIPLITSISSAIPSAIGGSLIIEIIFNIPGLGRLLYTSIVNYDWPVAFSLVMFIALITIISFFVAEVLYRKADPRIRKV